MQAAVAGYALPVAVGIAIGGVSGAGRPRADASVFAARSSSAAVEVG